MKRLSDKIRLLVLLVLSGVGAISCSKDMEDVSNVEISFRTVIQDYGLTRAFGDGLKVNTLVVAVFNEEFVELNRQEFAIENLSMDVRLSLAKDQTCNFVFWAYDSSAEVYDLTDMTAVKMRTDITNFIQAEHSDAFFATVTNIKVTTSVVEEVNLIRPLAQINVGTSDTAVKASFSVKNAANVFHPFTGTVSGEETFTWTFEETTDQKFSVNETPYTYLAMGYLFVPIGEVTQKDCELVLTDTEEKIGFPSVKLQDNYRSNIVGSF